MKHTSDINRRDIYQRVTDQIARQLEAGVLPWRKPWSADHLEGRIMRPLRHNGQPYNGINVLLLWAEALERGYTSPTWMTFNQALALIGHGSCGPIGRAWCLAQKRWRPQMTTAKPENLEMFTGTEQWYRHPLNRAVCYTDGAKYVADQVGAYWLLDEIALAQLSEQAVRAEAFQLWKLIVKDSAARLVCEDGNGRAAFEKPIAFTDFPEPGIELYFTDNVILLPSEY